MELFPLYHFTYGFLSSFYPCLTINKKAMTAPLQKGGVPAAPSGTATLLRLSPNHRFYPRATLAVTHARERIHRAMADARLLANPASWSRVADSSPNWEGL